MPLKLFAMINIYGRPAETEATIKSLNDSEIAPDTLLYLFVIPTPELSYDAVIKYLEYNRFDDVIVKYLDRKAPVSECYIEALIEFRNSDAEYFASIDNDVLFNPDWFQTLEQVKESLEYDGNQCGILNPINVPHGAYMPKQMPSYVIKKRMAGCVQVIPRKAALELPIDKKDTLWKRSPKDWSVCNFLYQKGYTHASTIISSAQHIGKKGNGMSERSWVKRGRGGEGFTPHEKIKYLWSCFNGSN